MQKTGLQRLIEYRDRHGYKGYELAELLDLTEAHLSQIINGKRVPGLDTATRIEDATGIPARSWLPIARGRSKKTRKDDSEIARVSGL